MIYPYKNGKCCQSLPARPNAGCMLAFFVVVDNSEASCPELQASTRQYTHSVCNQYTKEMPLVSNRILHATQLYLNVALFQPPLKHGAPVVLVALGKYNVQMSVI